MDAVIIGLGLILLIVGVSILCFVSYQMGQYKMLQLVSARFWSECKVEKVGERYILTGHNRGTLVQVEGSSIEELVTNIIVRFKTSFKEDNQLEIDCKVSHELANILSKMLHDNGKVTVNYGN